MNDKNLAPLVPGKRPTPKSRAPMDQDIFKGLEVQEIAPMKEVATVDPLDELLRNAKPIASSFEKLPEGQYQVCILEMGFSTSSTGKDMFVIKYKIVGGDYVNRQIFENFITSGIHDDQLKRNVDRLTSRLVRDLGIAQTWRSKIELDQTIKNWWVANSNIVYNVNVIYKVNTKTNLVSDFATIEFIK